jgi:hypothetical protein
MLRSVKVPGINYWVRCGRMPNGGRLRFWSDPRRACRKCATKFDGPGQPLLWRQPDTDGAITVSTCGSKSGNVSKTLGLRR